MSLLDERPWRSRIFTGSWRPASAGHHSVVAPATGNLLGRLGLAGLDDVDSAVGIARSAQHAWAELPFDQRAAVLQRAAEIFLQHNEEIADWLSREAGITKHAAHAQVCHTAVQECRAAAALAAMPYGELLRSGQSRLSMSRRRSVGVVGVIAPFNAPITLAIRAVAPALALGNAVVLKPDVRTGVSGGVVFARVFEEAGLPAGLLHVLPGGADVGQALVCHPRVPVIAFTGSTRAGRAIAAAAAPYFKRLHLEMGGNSAYIVLGDADIERAAIAGAFGSFKGSGQICMAASRHLVHESVVERYVDALRTCADRLTVGDTAINNVDLGPIIDAGQRDQIHDIVTQTIASGGRLVTGGTYDELFYRPTVFDQITKEMPAYEREIFGPVAPVTAFATLDEAAELASGTDYGLSLGIVTANPMKGLDLAARIPSGMVHINDQTINDEAMVPFGGLRDSGNGSRIGGMSANLEAFTEQQWVTIRDRVPDYTTHIMSSS